MTCAGVLKGGVAALGVLGCLAMPATAKPYRAADFDKVRKFDAHVHQNSADGALLQAARADNFEILSINVDYPDFPPIDTQSALAHGFHSKDPRHFHYAATFSMKGFGQPGWAAQVNSRIAAEKSAGAVAVKIWKNVGMVETDAQGHKIMLDDPGFDPVVARVVALKMALINHQGEPRNCWLPLDEMTTDNDRQYFSAHPDYYMYLHPEEPSYETLMEVRDRFVTRHPELNYVGAHAASLEWSVEELAKFLDAHPNATVDLAARMSQFQYQSARDRTKVRDFFVKYQDRILYGTDLTENPGDDPVTTRQTADNVWRADWSYLATGATRHVDMLHADIEGLALPRGVIRKIYYDNARRVFLGGK